MVVWINEWMIEQREWFGAVFFTILPTFIYIINTHPSKYKSINFLTSMSLFSFSNFSRNFCVILSCSFCNSILLCMLVMSAVREVTPNSITPKSSTPSFIFLSSASCVDRIVSLGTTRLKKKKAAPYFELMNKKKKSFEHFSVEMIFRIFKFSFILD